MFWETTPPAQPVYRKRKPHFGRLTSKEQPAAGSARPEGHVVDAHENALCPGLHEPADHAMNPHIAVQGRPEEPLCTTARQPCQSLPDTHLGTHAVDANQDVCPPGLIVPADNAVKYCSGKRLEVPLCTKAQHPVTACFTRKKDAPRACCAWPE